MTIKGKVFSQSEKLEGRTRIVTTEICSDGRFHLKRIERWWGESLQKVDYLAPTPCDDSCSAIWSDVPDNIAALAEKI